MVKYEPGFVQTIVSAEKPCTVIFSETNYPGWQVKLDGEMVKPSFFEGTFVALHVLPGLHEVVFQFKPWSFRIGLWITFLTLLLILFVICMCKLKIRTQQGLARRMGI